MAIIAHKQVMVVDINKVFIDAWNSPNLPKFVPRLDEVVRDARRRNWLKAIGCSVSAVGTLYANIRQESAWNAVDCPRCGIMLLDEN